MVSKSHEKNISKDNKSCGDQYSATEDLARLNLITDEIKSKQDAKKSVSKLKFDILDSYHLVQNKVGKCNVGHKLDRPEGCK